MSRFGETQFSISNYSVGKVWVRDIYSDSAIYPRLVIAVGLTLGEIQTSNGTVEYEMRDISGELRIAEGVVGLLTWAEGKRPCRPSKGYEHELRLVCELDPWRLEVLERYRNGAVPKFSMRLWPVILSGTEHLNVNSQQLQFEVPRERWLEFLSASAGRKFEVLEIQYSEKEAERFSRAIARTREAHKHIDHGEFDSAVAACRKVVEAFGHELKEEGEAEPLRSLFEKRTDERRAKEYLGIISKLKQLGGFAHHDFGSPLTYSRAEAQFVLRVTESLLSMVGALTVGAPK